MKKLLAGASLLPFLCAGIAAHAADAAPGAGEVSEVIVTGTRQVGVKAEDSAAPIQVVGSRNLTLTGATELAQSLATSVPSLNIQTNGGDAAAVNIQAALRGLSPNDTLVLVDGKRRHGTANLAVDGGSPYSGSATTDLSFIPIGAIDHVEVLTDGAAAQYGTDAIAGVVNIITKKGLGGTLDLTGGQYYNGEGTSGQISINKGFAIGDKGYFNVTLENRYHDFSVQGCGDARFQAGDCSLLTTTYDNNPINNNVIHAANYPHENQLNGDPQYNIYNAFVSAGYKVNDQIELYAIGSFGYREAQHYENYRTPDKISGTTSGGVTVYPYPNGFDPKEKFDEKDYSITGGARGTIDEWHYDLSATYGGNSEQVYVIDSGNAQLYPLLQAQSATPITPQTTFYNGEYKASEFTGNLDVNRDFAVGMASPLSVAFGGEYRRDTYGIGAGEPSSYYGAGAQSFDGYLPLDQGDYSRTNYAGYIDLALDPIKNLHLDLAGRYEHYSDFGSTEVGKATVRYDFNPMFAVRATVSNGFRAPTLAEEHYSGTNVSPYSADVQLPPNSAAAQSVGLGALHPELSQNYSVGFVAHPIDNLQVTVDAYQINLHDRILASGFLFGTLGETTISQGVVNAIKARGVTLDSGLSYTGISLFANSANTRTDGFEVTANYASDFGDYGHVDWTLGANYNKTQITKAVSLPADLQNIPFGQVTFFTKTSASALTTATPREKIILQAYYTYHKFSLNLRETIYGKTGQWSANNSIFETIGTTGITDLDLGYRVTSYLKVDIGANNLFNTIPPGDRTVVDGYPGGGGRVFNVPYGFAPYNANGGYYYGRVVVTF
jgi:iron complex outermembrane receptor protein